MGQADALVKDRGSAAVTWGSKSWWPRSPSLTPSVSRWAPTAVTLDDEHASPAGAFGGRLETRPVKAMRLGLDFVDLPYTVAYQNPFDTSKKHVLPNPPDPFFPTQKNWAAGKAWSADATFEHAHFMFRVEAMMGDRIDVDSTYGARGFAALWALAAYRFRLGSLHLMPAARIEWLDGDRTHPGGRHRQVSAALNVIFSKYARFLIDVTRSDVEAGSPISRSAPSAPGHSVPRSPFTRLALQLQVEL